MNPRNVEEVLMDFKGRRAGIIKALTKDVELFYNLCDPNHPNSCLYGLPDQKWKVNSSAPPLPPPDLPEPRSGINIVRDAMSKEEWLSMVAMHSDAWLHAVASYFSAKCKFDKADRKRLFNNISDMSLISELIMGGTTKKRAKAKYGSLPDEMLVEVLARLPVKDLLRYKRVCTKWRSMINDPNFISTHQRSYKGNNAENQLLVVKDGWSKRQISERVLVRRSDTFRKVTQLENLDQMDRCHVLGYVNGLALVTRNEVYNPSREIILWNPSINKFLNVPLSELVVSYFDVGLGFDSSKNDYKVVLFMHPRPQLSQDATIVPGLVQVYTLSTDSWTTKPNVLPPSHRVVGSQVFFNGAIHWMAVIVPNALGNLPSTYNARLYIVSFEVGDEVFNEMESPSDVFVPVGDNFLTVMDDCLTMFCVHHSEHDVWVMKDYGDANSWMKCYTFTLQCDKRLCFKGNGELLYANFFGIMAYDVKRNRDRFLARTYTKTANYKIYTHVESLVLSSLPIRVTGE